MSQNFPDEKVIILKPVTLGYIIPGQKCLQLSVSHTKLNAFLIIHIDSIAKLFNSACCSVSKILVILRIAETTFPSYLTFLLLGRNL